MYQLFFFPLVVLLAPAFSAQCSNKSCGVEPGNKAMELINLHLLSGGGQSAKATLPGSPVLTM